MAFTGKENILRWLSDIPGDDNKLQVRTAPGVDAFVFQQDEKETFKAAVARFGRLLETMDAGKYYAEVAPGNSRRNWYKEYIVLPMDTSVAPAVGSIGVSPDDIERMVNEKVAKIEMEREVNELRNQVKEYEKELEEPSPFEQAIGAVLPYLPGIMDKFFGGTRPEIALRGISSPDAKVPAPSCEDAELSDDDYLRLEVIGRRLAAIEPAYLDLLEKLCDKLEATPSLLTMIKSFV